MPNNKKDFALTFTQSHPDIVAKELEKMPPYKVASFLKSIPISVAPQVIEKMLSKKVAEICNILEPEKTTKFLTLMEIHSVISVLRHLDPERRRSILAHLPSKLRLCCKILLRYSDNSVGAWAYPQPNIIPFDYTVAEALQLIKNTQNRIPSNIIFIVNRYKAFIGFVDTYKLLQSPPDALIEALTKESEYCLYGTMKLDSILNHPGWEYFDVLPVLTSDQKIIGELPYRTLRKALETSNEQREAIFTEDMIAPVWKIYSSISFSFINLLSSFLEQKNEFSKK